MTSQLTHLVAAEQAADRRAQAARARLAVDAAKAETAATAESIVIRGATPHDRPALSRLAQLDGRSTPAGDVLVAEVGGRLQAALELTTGAAIADPFAPTAQVVELLQLRAARMGRRARARRPRFGRLAAA